MKYVNLHSHTSYSNIGMLDAFGTVPQLVSHCKKIGYNSVCLTDHGSVSGHIELIRTCKEEGLKPICGCEMYVTDDLEEMKKVRDKLPLTDKEENESDENQNYEEIEKNIKQKARTKMHFNVIAKNQLGLTALWKLVSISREEGYYFKPTVSWALLEKEKENLFFGTACEVGPLGRAVEAIKYEGIKNEEPEEVWMKRAEDKMIEKLQELYNRFGNSLYVEIIPVPDERARWKYILSYRAAKKLGIPLIATNDSHAPSKEDTKYQDMLYCAGQRRNDDSIIYESKDRRRYTPELFYNHSAEEMFERMKQTFPEFGEEDIKEMINNSVEIVEKNIEIVVEPKVPAVAYSDINDTKDNKLNLYKEIQRLIKKGWKFRKLDQLPPEKKEIYIKRVKKELEVILNKGYIDYFLIMADIMDWCETDRPFIENFDLWYKLNGKIKYPDKTKEEIYEILKEEGLFNKKEPIGTGIARGSAGGSLVTYLLRITNIDPIPGELLFERFIDYTRGNVYYTQNYDTYTKDQFKKEFPEEDLNKLKELKERYLPEIKEKIERFLEENTWYDKKQVEREFWLLEHNQKFSREEEYFYTLIEKRKKGEIEVSHKNKSHSILSYIMNITNKLTKEDYIVTLTDIPDIDSDFEDRRRDEVYIYLQNRYGYHNSARIATYTILKDKSTIDLLARIFPTNSLLIKELKENLEEYKNAYDISQLKSLKPKEMEDFITTFLPNHLKKIKFLPYISSLLGQVVAMGMHAAGIIVHNNPLSNYGAIYQVKDRETGKRTPVLCWDSRVAESMGLMKLDILGLNTVTNLKEVNKIVEERHPEFKHHWQRIPGMFEDEKTKKIIKDSSKWTGLFQLEGNIMKLLGKEVKPDNFEDVILVNAGGRPGPLEEAMKFGKIKRGELVPYYYENEIYKKITEKRGGILIYQEDIMQVAWQMCKYDDAMVGKIRKYISKSKKEDLDKLRPDFIKRLVENAGMKEEIAEKLWTSMEEFGRYAFNKAHSEAYSLLAYIQAYYKANYPLEFYTGMVKTLAKVSGKVVGTHKDKVYMLLKDFEENGYKILKPTVNKSKFTFEINKDEITGEEGLRIGFDYISGIGEKKAIKITENQPYKDYYDFVERSGADSKTINICKKLGMFNNIGGAPNVDEKILPHILFLEDLIKSIKITSELMKKEKVRVKEVEELLLLLGIKEEMVSSFISSLDIDEDLNVIFNNKIWKKIKTKINSKLKTLSNKFKLPSLDKKGKEVSGVFYNKEKENIQENLLKVIEEIKEISEEIDYIEKRKNKENIDQLIENVKKENIREYLIKEKENFESDCNSCGIENRKIKINLFKNYLSNFLDKEREKLEEILKDLDLNTELVEIKPSYKDYLSYCPILAKASLKKYKNLIPQLENFVPLRKVDFTKSFQNSVFAGVIIEKKILPENENPRKMRASITIRVDEYQASLFINGNIYNQNKEIIDKLEGGDEVLVLGNVNAGDFKMIQLNQIDYLKPVYNSFKKIHFLRKRKKEILEKKEEERTIEDKKFLEQIKGVDIRRFFNRRELRYLKIGKISE